MEESVVAAVPPPLPPKTRLRGSASARGGAPTPGAAPVAATGLSGSSVGGGGGALSSISTTGEHVVKIRISPEDGNSTTTTSSSGSVRISVGGGDEDMVRRAHGDPVFLKQPDRNANPYFFCSSFQSSAMVISSGQSSPSDTLDSGTCSDLDGSTPPPLPKKTGSLAAAAAAAAAAATVTVTVNGDHAGSLGNHRRTGSLTSSGAEADSDEDAGSNISCDSLNGHELNGGTNGHDIGDDGFMKSPLSNGIGKLHGHYHNHHDAMEIIEEERAVAPPPPPPLKSVALTVRANDFVNNIANGIKNLPSPVVIPEDPPVSTFASIPKPPPPKTPAKPIKGLPSPNGQMTFLPQGLLQDIRDRTATLTGPGSTGQKKLRTWGSPEGKSADASRTLEPKEYPKQASTLFRLHAAVEEGISGHGPKAGLVQERTYEERVREQTAAATPVAPRPGTGSYKYEEDRYYQFHLRERDPEPEAAAGAAEARAEEADSDEETFAGLRDVLGSKDASATIRSAKGTVRGVRNRVRAGIATFLHYPDTKNYKEKEAGKVVLYVTTMGIVRHTFQECLKVKKILRTLLVKYEERDAFMSREVQGELRERMHSDDVQVPQLFVEGQYIGGAETIERLNETGELRKMLKPFKSPDVCHECQVCGGFRLLPCSVCNGSKKSMHRNDFTAEFVALKCMHCDEVGLVKCHAC